MKDILLSLYKGSINPEAQYHSKCEEFKAARNKYCDHYDDFVKALSKLDPALAKQFMDIEDEQLSMLPAEYSETFISGFRLGARMMLEILDDDL